MVEFSIEMEVDASTLNALLTGIAPRAGRPRRTMGRLRKLTPNDRARSLAHRLRTNPEREARKAGR